MANVLPATLPRSKMHLSKYEGYRHLLQLNSNKPYTVFQIWMLNVESNERKTGNTDPLLFVLISGLGKRKYGNLDSATAF